MPLEVVPLESPVNVREILSSSPVPLRTNNASQQGNTLTVEQLFKETPMERRTGAQMARADMMDKAIKSAQENTQTTIQKPLETERVIGLYFSASWCPPCKKFTPQLSTTYSELKKQNRDFEIVFCSWDNKPEEYLRYASEMPWVRLPFRDPRIQQLSKAYNVNSIPTLVMVRANDNGLITKNARKDVPYDNLGKNYPWPSSGSGQHSFFGSIWHSLPLVGKLLLVGCSAWLFWQVAGRRMMRR